jgi:GAF domain-containing protein
MRATTVRFSDDLWALLEREAAAGGVSAAQFIRDATIMRVAYAMGERGEASPGGLPSSSEAPAPASHTGNGNGNGSGADVPEDVQQAVRDAARVRALRATGLLDSPVDEAFDRLARIAAEALNAPVALVSLVDENRQFFKSCLGLPEPWASERETPLSHSFCQHTLASGEPLVIDDAREHPALKDNPAIDDLNVVAYAGIPLMDRDGFVLGTLCAIDDKPRHWTASQVDLLKDIAASVAREIELHRSAAS